MFQKILIANRGEIAVRVIRTARALGIGTVAVYSDADRDALHVALADEAFWIGAAAPQSSYLDGDRILRAALETGAEAIHPGYGFLSENAHFARACAERGLVFIGPPPRAIEAMGLKAESKRLMERAGVPLVPGYHGAAQDDETLLREARRIGFPVLIKASAGGGGKGMKVAANEDEFRAALESARREAQHAFGNDQVLLERYLMRPRHVEIQIFADAHGHCIHLFERDCSVQRRHQKVIEEAPAPGMTPARRKAMGEAAVAAAQAVGYVGAGTVEFIVEHDFDDSGRFYFMEMNTRLQVEHPVTEMITGLDLVEWQLRVAAGQPLPKTQDELSISGHAFEARVYAENPRNQFLPATGRIALLHAPETDTQLRIDSGVRTGDEITPHYDPMIAKLIVRGDTREQALRRMQWALDRYAVLGLPNNVAFLQRVFQQSEFMTGAVDTGFIARHGGPLLPPVAPPALDVWAALALHDWLPSGDASAPASPWDCRRGFWLNQPDSGIDFHYRQGDVRYTVTLTCLDGQRYRIAVGKQQAEFSAHRDGGEVVLTRGESRQRYRVLTADSERCVLAAGQRHELQALDPYAPKAEDEAHAGRLTAPMPGAIVSVRVKAGDTVGKGQVLLVMEAMKMEHSIVAPRDGVIEAVFYTERETVKEGAELVALAASDADGAAARGDS